MQYFNLGENIFRLIVTFLSAFHVSAFWTRDKSRVPELSRWAGERLGAKLTVFQRSGTENGRHSIRSPQKPWKRKNYDSTGRDRGSGDRRLLPLVGSRDFTIFWETLLHGRAPPPFSPPLLADFSRVELLRNRFRNNQNFTGTRFNEWGNTRNASRISSISGGKSEGSWKQIYRNNRADSCETSFTGGENISG